MSSQGQIERFRPRWSRPDAVPLARMFVRELAEGEDVAAAFAVRERERRTRKNGDDFLRLVVADRTGSVEAVAWDAVDECFECSAPGAVVFIEGRFSIHPQYGAKITIKTIRAARDGEYDARRPRRGPAGLGRAARGRAARAAGDDPAPAASAAARPHLRRRVADLASAFAVAPAAKYYHQAYPHGLLDHTVSVAQAVSAAAAAFPGLDRDVAVTGALLHDIGKTQAYNDDPLAIDLTDAGRLLGEIPLGYYLVRRTIESIEGFDPELAQAVLHIVLSHHGSYENGSPVVPATREATLVHAMDNLGGKLGSFDRIERELPDGEAWSRFDRGIDSAAYFRCRARLALRQNGACAPIDRG